MTERDNAKTDRDPDDDILVRITAEKVLSGKEAFEWASANALPDDHVEFIHVETGEQINEWQPRKKSD